MMDILSENRKTAYPKSVTEFLRLEEERFVQGICYFIHKIPKIKKKDVNVQNINSIILELRDILNNCEATAVKESDVHDTVLQRCLGLFCIYIYFFKIRKTEESVGNHVILSRFLILLSGM
jgi:uncharacterized protein (UPF0305 family)